MKTIYLFFLAGFLIFGTQACTPDPLNESTSIKACCGDEGELPPPPPPPPPGGDGS